MTSLEILYLGFIRGLKVFLNVATVVMVGAVLFVAQAYIAGQHMDRTACFHDGFDHPDCDPSISTKTP